MSLRTYAEGLRGGLLALALCATAAAGSWWPTEGWTAADRPPPELGRMIPSRFSAWAEDPSAITQPISAVAAAKAGRLYAQTLERVYVDADQRRIMLSVSWGSQRGDRLQAHRPEYCYKAQGFTIGAVSDTMLTTGVISLPLRRVETKRPGRSEPVSYWMTVGEEATLPGITRKLAQLRQGLSGEIPDGFVVRISSLSESRAGAFTIHDEFIADLLAALPHADRHRLAGLTKS